MAPDSWSSRWNDSLAPWFSGLGGKGGGGRGEHGYTNGIWYLKRLQKILQNSSYPGYGWLIYQRIKANKSCRAIYQVTFATDVANISIHYIYLVGKYFYVYLMWVKIAFAETLRNVWNLSTKSGFIQYLCTLSHYTKAYNLLFWK